MAKGVEDMANININIRIDADLKRQFEAFCADMGMTMTTAFVLFAKKTVRENRIPFEIGGDAPALANGEASLAECAAMLGVSEDEAWERVCRRFEHRTDPATGERFWPLSDLPAMAGLARSAWPGTVRWWWTEDGNAERCAVSPLDGAAGACAYCGRELSGSSCVAMEPLGGGAAQGMHAVCAIRAVDVPDQRIVAAASLRPGGRVRFSCEHRGGEVLTGEVSAVDLSGGGVCDGVCPSVDVMAEDGVLYKHVPVSRLREVFR